MKRNRRPLALVLAILAMPVFAIAGCSGVPATLEETAESTPVPALSSRIVTIDINPSVELTVDAEGKVVEAKALNDDAKALLATLELEGLTAEDAVKLIVAGAIALGYLDPAATDNFIAIAVEDDEDEDVEEEEELEEDLQESAEEGLEEGDVEGEVDVSVLVAERIAAARELGIPPGRLNLVDRLAAALEQTRDDVLAAFPDLKVKDIMKAMKEARKPEAEEPGDEPQDKPKKNQDKGKGHGKGKGGSDEPEATPTEPVVEATPTEPVAEATPTEPVVETPEPTAETEEPGTTE